MRKWTVIGYYDKGDRAGIVFSETVIGSDASEAFLHVAKRGDEDLVFVCAVEGDQEVYTDSDMGETCPVVDHPGYPGEEEQ